MFFTAFPRSVRTEILRRDRYRCVSCGRSKRGGYLLHAAHFDHERNSNYANPENGRTLCIYCHTIEHLEEAREYGDYNPISALFRGVLSRGIRTKRYYKRHRNELASDQGEFIEWLSNELYDWEIARLDRDLADRISKVKYR